MRIPHGPYRQLTFLAFFSRWSNMRERLTPNFYRKSAGLFVGYSVYLFNNKIVFQTLWVSRKSGTFDVLQCLRFTPSNNLRCLLSPYQNSDIDSQTFIKTIFQKKNLEAFYLKLICNNANNSISSSNNQYLPHFGFDTSKFKEWGIGVKRQLSSSFILVPFPLSFDGNSSCWSQSKSKRITRISKVFMFS